jgi:hypothetical protein
MSERSGGTCGCRHTPKHVYLYGGPDLSQGYKQNVDDVEMIGFPILQTHIKPICPHIHISKEPAHLAESQALTNVWHHWSHGRD